MTADRRVALVTGAARGIGAATVLALAEAGWSVLAVDIGHDIEPLGYSLGTEEQLDDVVKVAMERFGDRASVEAFVADVRDERSLAVAVRRAEVSFGGLDAAVAAAGVLAGGVPSWNLSTERECAVIDVNLHGVLNLARHAVPAMLRRPDPRQGRFIAVASAAATRGLPLLAAYCAAKAGVVGFVRALAVELGASGVTANVVSPGSTATPILDESARLYGLASAQEFARQQPIRRLLADEEVAASIRFLVSDQSSAITGANLAVDGGLSL